MRPFDPLKVAFDWIDKWLWIAHPTHGRFFEQRTWLYYEVKEPIHRCCYRLGLTRDRPVTLYSIGDVLALIEPDPKQPSQTLTSLSR